MPLETVINMDGNLKFGAFVSPELPPGSPEVPSDSLVELSCENENALISGWFTNLQDVSGFPTPTSIVFNFKKGMPFSAILNEIGYSNDTKKLVLRNNGTQDGHWYVKITFK